MPKKQFRPRWFGWLLPLALLAVFLAMRLPGLGRFVTTDEALWLRRSGSFYLALSNGVWADTFQSPHPGALTQWAGAAGFYLAFPQYAQAGSPQIHDAQLLRLMENRGVNPMAVLAAGRAALVLVHAAAFLAAWPFARRLLGERVAALGLALIALDPLVIAHQRLLHLDGLLASFMLLSVLAYLAFLQDGKLASLAVSALAAGLAWLTKTPSWFLLPFIGAATVFLLWRGLEKKKPRQFALWLTLLIWLALAVFFFALLFPAMWVAPGEVLANMASYALGSAEGEYSGPVFFNGAVYPNGDLGAAGWWFYPLAFLWRSTPLVLLGLVCALWFAIARNQDATRQKKKGLEPDGSHSPLLLLLFSLGFMLFMTLAEKKFDRYLLPALPPLMLLAAWGWVRLAEQVRWLRRAPWRPAALILGVAVLQLASALPTFPYYLSYYNPLLGGAAGAPQAMMVGWGEGLDQAAVYLNQRADPQSDDVASWYSVSFNLMVNTQADDIPVALDLPQDQLTALLEKDYLVIYIHQWQRGTPQNLLAALESLEPEYRVWISGLEYARVYHLNQ